MSGQGWSASEKELLSLLADVRRKIAWDHGPDAAGVFDEITQAMVDHLAGTCRGITTKTWDRWARELLEDGENRWYDVWHRLRVKAHWHPKHERDAMAAGVR